MEGKNNCGGCYFQGDVIDSKKRLRDCFLWQKVVSNDGDCEHWKKFTNEKIEIVQNEAERLRGRMEREESEENSSPNLKPIITHALNTGMRRAEILGLTWNQVDLEARMIKVERTKSGRVRYIPINDDLFKQFLKLKSDNGESPFVFLNPETKQPFLDMKTPFKRACRISGIEGMRFHDLRHTFASRLVANGIDIETVRDLLGHHSIVVTQRYVHSSDEQKRKAVEILNKKTEKKAKMVTKMVTIENQSELIS